MHLTYHDEWNRYSKLMNDIQISKILWLALSSAVSCHTFSGLQQLEKRTEK
jgi:hypothetical protein